MYPLKGRTPFWWNLSMGQSKDHYFLYVIFLTPLFDLHIQTDFADFFIIRWNSGIDDPVADHERSLEAIHKWLRGSGLTFNESKTELYPFHRFDQPQITINLFNSVITSKNWFNVLGVLFDSKLQWSAQVSQTVLKALCTIRLVKNYYNKDELCTLLTANFYSILYFNSEIWHISTLNQHSKQLLFTASAKALKLCIKDHSVMYSYNDIHIMTK
jgi:hypothetical protein